MKIFSVKLSAYIMLFTLGLVMLVFSFPFFEWDNNLVYAYGVVLFPSILLSIFIILKKSCPHCGCCIFCGFYLEDAKEINPFKYHMLKFLIQAVRNKAVCPCCNAQLGGQA